MASARYVSASACILSIRWLFRDVGQRQLGDVKPSKICYLWTFTMPTEEGRLNPRVLMASWRKYQQWASKQGHRMVRVAEMAPTSGFWHVHAVTDQYWLASDIWEAWGRFEGGRVDVKAVPVEYAGYVAKYLFKSQAKFKGRRWGCVGFEGVPISRVRVKETLTDVTKKETVPEVRPDVLGIALDNLTILLRHKTWSHRANVIKMIKLTKTTESEILTAVAGGKLVSLGEYRSTKVKKMQVEDFKHPGTKVTKVAVTHSIEFGGESIECTEWLPDGADENSVKPPADKGDLVIVVVTKATRWGYSTESIKPVSKTI